MSATPANSYTCFNGHQRIMSGTLQTVALGAKWAIDNETVGPVLVFEDATGRLIDIDTSGSDEEVVARSEQQFQPVAEPESVGESHSRGRPKLGVVAREVTLLPRHWEWLATQPGGASVALRKLVEEARRTHSDKDKQRNAQERTYRFISAVAGNLPDFEEATRALFANDLHRFTELMVAWPDDVRDYALALASVNEEPVSE